MMFMDIYTLKALAEREQVSYDHLRHLVVKIDQGRENQWRGYRFIRPGKRYWLAYSGKQEVRFHDVP